MSKTTNLAPNDLSSFWMPFTANRQFKANPRMFVSAKDMHYTTDDGRQILDGTAGLWCVNAGHSRPKIVKAVEYLRKEMREEVNFDKSTATVMYLEAHRKSANSTEEKNFSEILKAAEALREKFNKLENELTQNQYETPSDRLRHPTMLKERMEALVSVVAVADAAPPQQAYSVFEHLSALIDRQLTELSELEEQEVVGLNQQIDHAGIRKLQG